MKFFWFLSSSTTPEHFEREWQTIADRWTPSHDLNRWVRSLAVRESTPFFGGTSPLFAAVEELWLAPHAIDNARKVMSDIKNGLGDALKGVINEKSLLYLVENNAVIDGPECIGGTGIRQFALARRRSDISHEDYVMHLRYVHGPLVRNSPALSRYVQNRVVRDINIAPYYDAFSELSFVNMEAVRRFCESEAYLGEQITDDAPKFVDLNSVLPTMVDKQWDVMGASA